MVELDLLGVHTDGKTQNVVLLRHEERFLPIAVGFPEAEAISAALAGKDFGRPMTHDLICNLLAGLHGELQSVSIYKLEKRTFYAHLNIVQRSADGQVQQVLRVDSRPSDGIAIACRVKAPIFASELVMDLAGEDISILSSNEENESEDEESDFEE